MSKITKNLTGYGLTIEAKKESDENSSFIYYGDVLPEWIDMNGHMNVAYYVKAFDLAIDVHWAELGITQNYIEIENLSTFSVESHITYQDEMKVREKFRIASHVLAYDDKRIHLFQRMYKGTADHIVATAEWMNLHVNLETRRVTPWPSKILMLLEEQVKAHKKIIWPDEAGKRMSIKNPLYEIKSR